MLRRQLHSQMFCRQAYKLQCSLLLALLFVLSFAIIPAQAAPISQSSVQRIRFAPGATSATLDATLNGGQTARYVMGALAGQQMTVQATSEDGPVFLTVFDPSGNAVGTTFGRTQWSGRLPASGDYRLNVNTSPYVDSIDYRLRVEITNAPATPDPAPERIQFARGAISTQVTGYLPSAATKRYVLGARAGQLMTIESWSGGGPFRVSVATENGTQLGAANVGERWRGTLPSTQDYNISLQSPADGPPTNYGLVITIQTLAATPTPVPPPSTQRIRFPTGATNTTVWDYVDNGTPVRRYVLRALRGQTMSVRLTTLNGHPASVNIYSEQWVFLGSANLNELWTGYLPATQDYYLEVLAPTDGYGDDFSLWVGIR
jgi:hypothetical protein